MKTPTPAGSGAGAQPLSATAAEDVVQKKNINVELWQACAGPLVNLPVAGTHVVYFPQGHSEQVAASMRKDADAQVPNYSNLPSKLLCLLHDITLHADPETDEVYAQMTLQPVPSFDKDALLRSDLSMKINKPQTEFFCKTLTASDTSTHGGFSVPRRAAEKIFPTLDFTMQPPAQELVARDLHDNVWTFRHIYRGQPKRHLLTTGWSLFVSGKRLFAGDSVLFIRDEKQQLLLGIRRANRQPTNLSSSVLSSDSMHIGILAAAAHATANNSPFTVFYNPRTSQSEFVIPLAKYYKAVCSNQISLGMRFRMMFETEESGTRRYMGTITGISDLDPVRWKNSQWRNLQVGWDESTADERRTRVSVWEIEPVTAPFFLCPTPPLFGLKRPRQPGMPDEYSSDLDSIFRRTMPWLGDDFGLKDTQPSMSLVQWMNMQQNPSLANSMQPNYMSSLPGSVMSNFAGTEISPQMVPGTQILQQHNLQQFDAQRQTQPIQQLDQLQKQPPTTSNHLGSIVQLPQQLTDVSSQTPRQNAVSQTLPTSEIQPPMLPSHSPVLDPSILQQQQQPVLNHQLQRCLSQNLNQQRQNLRPNQMQHQPPDHVNQKLHLPDNQIQLQLLQKVHQQQQQSPLAAQPAAQQVSQLAQPQDNHQKQPFDVPQSFSRPTPTSQMLAPQATSSMPHEPHAVAQQIERNDSQTTIQPKLQQQWQQSGMVSELAGHVGHTVNTINNQLSVGSSSLITGAAGGGRSAVTDDVPSCSTSPSTNNCPSGVRSLMNGRNNFTTITGNEIAQSATALSNPSGLETISSSGNVGGLLHKADVKPSVNVSGGQDQRVFAAQAYLIATGTQIDYLDSSSSATSVLSQNDGRLPQNNSTMPFHPQSMFGDVIQDGEIQGESGSNAPFMVNIDNQIGVPMMPDSLITRNMVGSGRDFPTNLSSGGGMLSSYENLREPQPELSSSMVSQSFGVPDVAFNSIDSTINNGSFLNRGAWAPQQIPRLRTFTKVYKRGAVGRSIDITRYSGYDELKQDLARRFGIEGQLEDRQRIGWKLVYVDHENDVLLVGDDPWEEFLNCVRCIRILSPQEVQQMSLDGDIGNNIIPNQACSSSDNGVS